MILVLPIRVALGEQTTYTQHEWSEMVLQMLSELLTQKSVKDACPSCSTSCICYLVWSDLPHSSISYREQIGKRNVWHEVDSVRPDHDNETLALLSLILACCANRETVI